MAIEGKLFSSLAWGPSSSCECFPAESHLNETECLHQGHRLGPRVKQRDCCCCRSDQMCVCVCVSDIESYLMKGVDNGPLGRLDMFPVGCQMLGMEKRSDQCGEQVHTQIITSARG